MEHCRYLKAKVSKEIHIGHFIIQEIGVIRRSRVEECKPWSVIKLNSILNTIGSLD